MKPMKHVQIISRKTVRLLLLIFVLTFCMVPVSSYADGPWTDRADQSIYDSAGDAPDSSTPDMLDGGIFAELLGEFCIGIGDGLNFLLTSFGCDLNAIIFGRVGGASARTGDVALFSFDMGTGNIYGLVGMAMYGYLRNLVFTLMVPVFLYYLVGFLYSNGNPRVKERLLGMTKLFVASSIGFILFPQLLGIALYLRDAMLHALMTGSQSMILKVADSVGSGVNMGDNSYAFFFGSGGDYNLISQFRAMAKPNGKVVFINSILYVGAVVYQAYLAVCYISAAVCMVVLVLLFPFAALFEMVERGTISNWMRQVLGILLNPVIDSCLLLIPMFFMIIGTAQESKGYALIALIICGCIIPARGVIRGFLHIGNGMGMELAGFGTIMGATSLMRSIGSGIGAAAGALAHASSDAKSDKRNADMMDDLADVQKKKDLEDVNKGEELQSEMEDIIGNHPDLNADDADTSFAFGYRPTPKEDIHEKSPHAQAAATAQNIASGIDAIGRKKDSLNEDIRSNDSKIASIGEEIAMDNEQIASMKAEKQAIQAEQNEQKKRGDTPSADGYARIRELDQGIGEAEHSRSIRMEEQSRLRGENARTKEKIGRIDALSARARSAISPSRSSFGGGVSGLGSGISQEEQEILDQYATIDNFESPQFKNISLERKAALYRERAAKTRVRGATTAAGTMAGMTFGATAGMAMTAFSSPAAKMQMTAIGGAMGANAGSILGEVMAEPVYEGGVELVRMGGPLLQKGATILKDKAEAYRNNPEGLNVYEEEPQKMLEVNVHSSLKPAVTTVSQSQDNNQSSVETVSGPGSKEQPSYQSEVEAVGKDAGAQSGPQVTYTETVSDEDAAIMQQFYEAEIQKPEFRRTMHHAYTDSAVSARQVYSGLKNSMVNATKEERAVANEQIIETAFMQYTNTILDSLDAPEHVDQITYQQAVEDRLREDERGRIEKYLRSKHLLF